MSNMEMCFRQFRDAYPRPRRYSGQRAREAFAVALTQASFETLTTALEQHKRSVQWQNPRFVPSMIAWLEDERWIQVLPEIEVTVTPADEQRILNRLTPFERAKRAGLK
jgi:hypothetical protein